jgi:hypothetical protein
MALGASDTTEFDKMMGALGMLSGSKAGAQKAFDAASAMYAPVEEANPWEASLRFFLEMGKQASQPGATVLGSAVGAGLVPLDYLTAKKKEKRDRDQKVASTAFSLAPTLKPKAVGKGGYTNVMVDGVAQVLTSAEIQAAKKEGKTVSPYEKPSATTSTFKERKFYKTGFDPAVVKNENDAADFEAQGWSSVPPVDWTDSKGATSEDAAEVQSSKILDSGVVVTVMKDGTSKVLDGAGNELTGDARTDAIRIAEERGIELQGDRSGARRAAVVGVDTALSAFEKVGQIRTNISNLNEAKRLVVEEGANTGVIESLLPSWRASTIELQNVRSSLGLDVVGSVTFGALSAGELSLALNTALPTNLQEEALADWLDRKIDAQQKLSEYLTRQAVYLSDGDKTVGDWLRFEKEYQEKRERQEAEQRQSGTNYDFTNMSAADMAEIDVSTLTGDQFDAWEERMDELGL